mgnify:CR=1 FL=1
MNSIILDSSLNELNVGLSVDDKLFKTSYEAFQQQSELMIPELNKLLKANNVDKKDIQSIIVTNGPGSYTGLRIALTIAKIYAFAVNCPVYQISSLNAMIKKDKETICLMNARSGRSYIGVYKNEVCLLEDQILSNEDVLDYINKHKDYVVSGNTEYLGVEGYKADIIQNLFDLKNEKFKVENLLSLKAKYLKD